MRHIYLLISVFTIALFSCTDKNRDLPDGMYAVITTGKGEIVAQLEFEKTPVTVANFVTLTEGTNTFVDKQFKGKPFYSGLRFHRVLQNFMIQGGDPLGNGSGDAGYRFRDEITNLLHNKAGILSMANSGPGTNSSQFFITHLPTPWLDGKHTVFGHVVEGMDNVNKIVQDDALISVEILRIGEAAKKFDAVKTFNDNYKLEVTEREQAQAEALENKRQYTEKFQKQLQYQLSYFAGVKSKTTKTRSGLQYNIVKKGSGKKPAPGSAILINYAGFLEDGTLFDTSQSDVAKKFGVYNEMRANQGGYSPLPFVAGKKTGIAPGIGEGLDYLAIGDKAVFFIPSHLGYGEAGAGNGVIPPNANLIFEIEILEPK